MSLKIRVASENVKNLQHSLFRLGSTHFRQTFLYLQYLVTHSFLKTILIVIGWLEINNFRLFFCTPNFWVCTVHSFKRILWKFCVSFSVAEEDLVRSDPELLARLNPEKSFRILLQIRDWIGTFWHINPVLWNRNNLLRFQFRRKSFGSGLGSRQYLAVF